MAPAPMHGDGAAAGMDDMPLAQQTAPQAAAEAAAPALEPHRSCRMPTPAPAAEEGTALEAEPAALPPAKRARLHNGATEGDGSGVPLSAAAPLVPLVPLRDGLDASSAEAAHTTAGTAAADNDVDMAERGGGTTASAAGGAELAASLPPSMPVTQAASCAAVDALAAAHPAMAPPSAASIFASAPAAAPASAADTARALALQVPAVSLARKVRAPRRTKPQRLVEAAQEPAHFPLRARFAQLVTPAGEAAARSLASRLDKNRDLLAMSHQPDVGDQLRVAAAALARHRAALALMARYGPRLSWVVASVADMAEYYRRFARRTNLNTVWRSGGGPEVCYSPPVSTVEAGSGGGAGAAAAAAACSAPLSQASAAGPFASPAPVAAALAPPLTKWDKLAAALRLYVPLLPLSPASRMPFLRDLLALLRLALDG
jgi:hypothetical protein